MHSFAFITPKAPVLRVLLRSIGLISVAGLVGMTVRCASAQSVVFSSANPTKVANTAATPTDTMHQAYAKRVSANQRGDIFWVNSPYSSTLNGDPTITTLVELPLGGSTPVTVATNLSSGSNSVAVDPQNNLYVMNGNTHVVYIPFVNGTYPTSLDLSVQPPSCTYPVSGTTPCDLSGIYAASLGYYVLLSDIQVDTSGNIYATSFYDTGVARHRVLEYSGATGGVTVLVDGLGGASFSDAQRLAVTPSGDIYVTDSDTNTLYYSAAASGTFSTVSGFTSPNGVSVDGGGDLYITDTGTNSVTFVPNIGGAVNLSNAYVLYNSLFLGNQVWGPVGVDGSGQMSYEAGQMGGSIVQAPINSIKFGTENSGVGASLGPISVNIIFSSAATFGSFTVNGGPGISPYSISGNTCNTGTAYVAGATCSVNVTYTDTGAGSQPGVIEALSDTGVLLGSARLSAFGIAPLMNIDPGTVTPIGTTWHAPSSIAVDAAGNTYVSDSNTGGIYENGSNTAIVSGFSSPSAVAVDAAGNLYVADTGNGRIQEIPFVSGTYGAAVTLYTGVSGPSGLTLDYSGNLYVADSGNSRVLLLASAGNLQPGSIVTTIGSGLTTPVAVAVDNFGNNLYVADDGTKTIVQVALATSVQTTVLSGLRKVAGLALDASASLYIVDGGAQTISRVGNNSGSFGSSTTLPTIVGKPAAVAVDALGNLYAADTADATVAQDNRTVGSLNFGSVIAGSTSSPLTATVTNGGANNTNVIFDTPPYTELGSTADFAVQSSSSCAAGSSIYYGNGCTLSFVFIPVSPGPYSDTLTLSSSTTASNTLVLSGTGTAPLSPPVLSCPASLTTTYNAAFSESITVQDPQGDAVTVVWSVDGTTVHTDNVAATASVTSLSYSLSLSAGAHTIGVTATDMDAQSSTCSTAVTVSHASQTITFAPPASVAYGSAPITLTATGGASGNSVTFTLVSGPATLNGSTLTFTGAGSVVVTANQAGNASYLAASAVTRTITVSQATQTITFAPPATVAYGSAPITLTATGGASGNTVTFTLVSGPATLSGSTLTFIGAGSVVVTANQAGNANYLAATPVTQTINVSAGKAPQAITFAPPASAVYGSAPITLTATGGGSGNAVTFTLVSGPATLSGSTLTFTGAGSVVVTANQAGNASYLAAAPVTQTITVSQAAQTITFTPPASVAYGSAPITLTATGGASGNAVTFTLVSGPATLNGSTLTLTGAGSIVVSASQAGNTNYLAASTVTQTITVSQASQTITFAPPTSAAYGSAAITLTATGGASGNAVTFTLVSGPATLSGSTLTFTAAGAVVVSANQPGNTNYLAASPVTQTITVSQATQTISFAPPASVAYGSGPITLTATGGASGNAVTFTLVSGPATLSGSTLTFTGAGSVVVSANQAGNTNYLAASPVTQTITVSQATQTISFAPPVSVAYGSAPITLTATGGASGNAVTFTLVSGPATLTGSTLTFTGPGSVVVSANQAGNTNYLAASTVTATIVVSKATPTNALTIAASPLFISNPDTLSAKLTGVGGVSPTGTVTFYSGTTSLGSGTLSAGVASITTTFTAVGTYSITAVYSGDSNYGTQTSSAVPVITEDFTLNVASTSAGTVTVSPGTNASYSMVVTPLGGPTFPSALILAASGGSSSLGLSVSPATVTAGAGATNFTLSVVVPNKVLAKQNDTGQGRHLAPIFFALLFLPLLGSIRKARRKLRGILAVAVLLTIGIAAGGLSGCGVQSGYFAQQPETYTLTVTGTAGALTHSTTVTLNVQ